MNSVHLSNKTLTGQLWECTHCHFQKYGSLNEKNAEIERHLAFSIMPHVSEDIILYWNYNLSI